MRIPRALDRFVIWLVAAVGGVALVYAALTAPPNFNLLALGAMEFMGVLLLAVAMIGGASEIVLFVHRLLPDIEAKPSPSTSSQLMPVAQPLVAPALPPVTGPSAKDMANALAARTEREGPAQKGRSFITVDRDYLDGLFEDHTSAQMDALLADYVGQWVEVSGSVSEVNAVGSTTQVWIGKQPLYYYMTFSGEWAQRTKVLLKGTRIEVVGRIKGIDNISVDLTDCELSSLPSSPNTAKAPRQ